jgi:hypothetical protein
MGFIRPGSHGSLRERLFSPRSLGLPLLEILLKLLDLTLGFG